VVCDLVIASTMVWALLKGKIHSKRLKFRVTRLVYIIIGSGVLIATVNISTLILAATKQNISYASGVIISKLYANSMMVVLNNRTSVAYSPEVTLEDSASVELTTIGFDDTPTTAGPPGLTDGTIQLAGSESDGSSLRAYSRKLFSARPPMNVPIVVADATIA